MNDEAKTDKKMISLRLSPSAAESVQKIAHELGITTSEVFRRALGTELFLLEAKERGDRILLEDRDRNVREVVIR